MRRSSNYGVSGNILSFQVIVMGSNPISCSFGRDRLENIRIKSLINLITRIKKNSFILRYTLRLISGRNVNRSHGSSSLPRRTVVLDKVV